MITHTIFLFLFFSSCFCCREVAILFLICICMWCMFAFVDHFPLGSSMFPSASVSTCKCRAICIRIEVLSFKRNLSTVWACTSMLKWHLSNSPICFIAPFCGEGQLTVHFFYSYWFSLVTRAIPRTTPRNSARISESPVWATGPLNNTKQWAL